MTFKAELVVPCYTGVEFWSRLTKLCRLITEKNLFSLCGYSLVCWGNRYMLHVCRKKCEKSCRIAYFVTNEIVPWQPFAKNIQEWRYQYWYDISTLVINPFCSCCSNISGWVPQYRHAIGWLISPIQLLVCLRQWMTMHYSIGKKCPCSKLVAWHRQHLQWATLLYHWNMHPFSAAHQSFQGNVPWLDQCFVVSQVQFTFPWVPLPGSLPPSLFSSPKQKQQTKLLKRPCISDMAGYRICVKMRLNRVQVLQDGHLPDFPTGSFF